MRDFFIAALSVGLGGLLVSLFHRLCDRRRPVASRELEDIEQILRRLDGIEASVRRLWVARRRIE